MNEENRKLLAALDNAVCGEWLGIANTIGQLIQADEQELYRHDGHGTLVDYCTKEHGMDPEEAQCRAAIARVAKEHPAVRDVFVNQRLVPADWKKPLGQLSPGKAVARAFVNLCRDFPFVDIEFTDEELEELRGPPRPKLSIVAGCAGTETVAAPGSARRLRP